MSRRSQTWPRIFSVKTVIANSQYELFPLLFPCRRSRLRMDRRGVATWREILGLMISACSSSLHFGGTPGLQTRATAGGLTLLGFNAAFIQWGDSIRAYGLGILLILISARPSGASSNAQHPPGLPWLPSWALPTSNACLPTQRSCLRCAWELLSSVSAAGLMPKPASVTYRLASCALSFALPGTAWWTSRMGHDDYGRR